MNNANVLHLEVGVKLARSDGATDSASVCSLFCFVFSCFACMMHKVQFLESAMQRFVTLPFRPNKQLYTGQGEGHYRAKGGRGGGLIGI